MKISVLVIFFFITIPIIVSYNFTSGLKPQKFLLVDAAVKLIEGSFVIHKAKGVSVSTTSLPRNHESFQKHDMILKLFHSLETQIRYRFFHNEPVVKESSSPRYHNVIFLNNYKDFRFCTLTYYFCITPTNLITFFSIFYQTMDPKIFDYRGYYFIILGFYKDLDLKMAFEHLFSKYILNVHILVLNNENRKEVLIYTYFPFEENNCEKINPIIWNVFKNGTLVDDKTIFPNKIDNMNGCKIKVSVFVTPPFTFLKTTNNQTTVSGIEGLLLNFLSKRINFTLDLYIITNELLEQTCKVEKKPSHVLTDHFRNISIGAIGLTSEHMKKYFDSTNAHIHISLLFVFLNENWRTSFENFFKPFQIQTWFCLCLLFCLGAILITALKYTKRSTRNFIIGPTDTPLFDMITIFLKNPITRPSTRNFARTLTLFWLFLSTIVSTAYQGTLFGYLQRIDNTPRYTINELVNNGFKFFMPQYVRILLSVIPEVYENIDSSSDHLCVKSNRTHLKSKQAMLLSNFVNNHLNQIDTIHDRQFATSANIYQYPLSMVLKKSSYLKTKLDREIEKYLANGLIKYWIGNNEKVSVITPNRGGPSELTVNELLGCFQICLIFYFFSILVFVLELSSVKIRFVKKIMNWLIY